MQTASFISGHCTMLQHSFPFTPFDPDLLFLLLFFFFFVRLHTINVCHLLMIKKNKTKENPPKKQWTLTGSSLAALSACIWATRSSTGDTGTSTLIISPRLQQPGGSHANNMNSNCPTWLKNSGTQSILHAFCMEW